ncbi:MAG: ABC transporter permease, partial [Rhodospirillaceae bacterium]|nr:ABC transporter permease [Rhodospirillaceae bacterium]
MASPAASLPGRRPSQIAGGWEAGLLALMALLYLAGSFVNPTFFGSADALHAVLRDAARYAVMAVGMTFVIVNKDLDLSVGSTYGLVGVAFSILFDASHLDLGVGPAVAFCLGLGLLIGLVNGLLVTVLRVPAFIATLTMLLILRGVVLGLTGGKSILYPIKARDFPLFFHLGETNALGFNNQIPLALVIILVGAVVLAKTRWGYETFATGGNELAAVYAGIATRWVRVRAYVISSLCATLAGLMATAQDKGVTAQAGL